MFKRKIKIMAAMLSLVILVACVGDTFSKYTATNYTTVDMDIEMPYNANLHQDSLLSPAEMYHGITYTVQKKDANGDPVVDANGDPVTEQITCRVLVDTNKASISLSDDKRYLRVTTHKEIAGDQAGYCFDPNIILDFQTAFEVAGMTGYKFLHTDDQTKVTTDYYGLPTSSVRYAVIPYFIPYVDPATLPKYTYGNYTTTYSTYNYDHLRVYTTTTENRKESFGTYRYYECPRMIGDLEGTWMCVLIDLKQTNLRDGDGSGNGTPNWEGNLYQLRLDIGRIGALENWYLSAGDCPDGMTMYIGDIRFFSSLYGAERTVQNLYYDSSYDNGIEEGVLKAKTDPSNTDQVTFNDYADVLVYSRYDSTLKKTVWETKTYADWKAEQEKLAAGS